MTRYILNIPWTLFGLVLGLFSFPSKIEYLVKQYVFVFRVKKLWWAVNYLKNARAMAIGHVILLCPKTEKGDLEHELVHVRQFDRLPFVFPFFYYFELLKNGYRNNRFEIEAYKIADNPYKGVDNQDSIAG